MRKGKLGRNSHTAAKCDEAAKKAHAVPSGDSEGAPRLVNLFEDIPDRADFPSLEEYGVEFMKRNIPGLSLLRSGNRTVLLAFVDGLHYQKCMRGLYMFNHEDYRSLVFASPFGFGGGVALFVNPPELELASAAHPLGRWDSLLPADHVLCDESGPLLLLSDSTRLLSAAVPPGTQL